MKDKRILGNVISSLFIYGTLLIFSIVSSRLVLVGYGSETNGLLASINQIFSYIALLEAGIGTATITALYKPLADKDTDAVRNVLASSRRYYRSCTKWYLACVVLVSFVWPLLLDTVIPYWTIWGAVFFQGISGVITFWYTSTVANYLVASGRNYVNNNIHVSATVLTYLIKILICCANLNIVCISLSMMAVNTGKCLVYRQIMKKYCPEYDHQGKVDLSLLKERKAYLIHEISSVVFSSTDTILLSVFCGLKEASVYAVYSLVLSALRTILGQVFSGTSYILGEGYAGSKEKYPEIHDCYNCSYIVAVFAVYTVAYLLILPFVSLYTEGIRDANYSDPLLPLLFVLIELLSSCRIVDGQLIKIAFHARQTIGRTITEAAINLTTSVVLVQFIGMYGVLFGTIFALLYRSNDIILYANHRILHRSAQKEYMLYAVNFSVFAMVAWVNAKLEIAAATYLQLVVLAAGVFLGVAALYLLVNLIAIIPFRKTVLRRS